MGRVTLETLEKWKPKDIDDYKKYAIWNDKDPYTFSVKVIDGCIKISEEVWGINEFSKDGTFPVYLGEIQQIEKDKKYIEEAQNGDVVTLYVLHNSIRYAEYSLKYIAYTKMCHYFETKLV